MDRPGIDTLTRKLEAVEACLQRDVRLLVSAIGARDRQRDGLAAHLRRGDDDARQLDNVRHLVALHTNVISNCDSEVRTFSERIVWPTSFECSITCTGCTVSCPSGRGCVISSATSFAASSNCNCKLSEFAEFYSRFP